MSSASRRLLIEHRVGFLRFPGSSGKRAVSPWAVLLVLIATGCVYAAETQRQVTRQLAPDVQATLEFARFRAEDHDVVYCATGFAKYACVIDGMPAFGTHHTIPALKVTALFLDVDGKRIELDFSGMYNPRSPREDKPLVMSITDRSEDTLVVRGKFSDGAAAYMAEWKIVRGHSVRTLLRCVECVEMMCSELYK